MAEYVGFASSTPHRAEGHVEKVHEVLIPLYDGVQPLDVTGQHEVFAAATKLLRLTGGGPGYRLSLVAAEPGPVRAESGLALLAGGPLPESGHIGTLLVPGGAAYREQARRPRRSGSSTTRSRRSTPGPRAR